MANSELAKRIQQDTITTMRAKDKDRLTVMRMLQAAIKQVEIDTREELDDEGVVKVLRAYLKKVKDSLAGARDGGREDLVARAEAELAIVESYLPAELDDEVLEAIVREAIAGTGASSLKDMGQVMKAAMARTGGRADGNRVSALVKSLLAG
ncbi:GatB/YqeY domain-containing protein [bacterium]|nr:GatB/YqeY domain-containing protein [bacterium]MBU1073964.1 GatB/YqeY domain-containing protein [bacterium]MBU1674860.1 GatB/YqeY domain-containing protein [bacterium]